MPRTRVVEIFSAGCAVCDETVALVRSIGCPSCDIRVLDMHDPAVAARARTIGVRRVPAVAVDGALAACCADNAPDEAALCAAGIGQPTA